MSNEAPRTGSKEQIDLSKRHFGRDLLAFALGAATAGGSTGLLMANLGNSQQALATPESLGDVDRSTKQFVKTLGDIFGKLGPSGDPLLAKVEIQDALALYMTETRTSLGLQPIGISAPSMESLAIGMAAFHALHQKDIDPRAQEFLYNLWRIQALQTAAQDLLTAPEPR